MTEIEEITDVAKLADWAGQWNEIVAQSAHGDFFQTYEWLSAWLSCFWKDRPIRFLLLKREGRLIGAAPLLVDGKGEIRCKRTLATPVNPHTTRFDLPQAESAEVVLRETLTYLRRERKGIKVCLPCLEDDTATKQALPAISRELHLSVLHKTPERASLIRIRTDHATYWKSLDGKVRHNVERKRRKLESSGALCFRIISTADELSASLEDLREIERHSWKEEAGSSITAAQSEERFYAELAHSCASKGWLRLYLMYLDDRPVAFMYAVVYKKVFYALKTSYHLDFHNLSPGSVIVDRITRDAFAEQLGAVDFLGVESNWKKQLSNDARTRSNVCLFSRGNLRCWYCACVEQGLKPFVKNRLPYAIALRRKLLAYLRRRAGKKA